MVKILIVEDDISISDLIKLNLNMANYESRQAYDGEDALKLVESEKFDLILLDVMLPKVDGFTLFEKIKKLNIPTIFLTAKVSVADRVYGLKLGADDYITKPFEGIELLARIENALRHYNKKKNIFLYKNIEINVDERKVKIDNKDVELTLKEFELLLFLVENKNSVLTREKILERVWNYDYYGETRTVDNHIQRIRKKLNLKNEIKTIFGLGYRLVD
ncbi:response regulator transcription factor [Clostridium guangxiense]|uniref:response regulator transcription factor n=1 Tax=Clostridium guangxiense TaxID=1662055 RepID=UPI001E5BE1F4|nr:response regulator transcription factor [Clostridium guangxiense]MCD2347906.1 response regulator transcription factor [Clostridium guangxiense]